ncbi:MAG: tetratricopeptide repeat protein [Myxococcales bacterium]|nr:tetratricopeptide repeat protein [Myxococcota bacterium]MDW8280631.1 tetratricopeptide repeat protein [Myxococcales bacterium]
MDLLGRFNRLAAQVGELITDDVRGHVELGAALLERGDPEAAIYELEQALARRRDHARALYLLGLCHLRRGDLQKAREALQEAMRVREGFAEAQVALGEVSEREGDLEAAADSYRTVLSFVDDEMLRCEVQRRLGAVYLRTGRLDKAVRELRKAASAAPDDAEIQGLLGQALIQRARQKGEPSGGPMHGAARLCLQRAAQAERPSPGVLAALGALLLEAGQFADSEQALRRALEVEPSCVPALLALGRLRLCQGDVAAAYEQALRAAAVPAGAADAADLHLLLARCHARSGEPERALRAYEEAARALEAGPPHRLCEVLQESLQLSLQAGLFAQATALAEHPLLSGLPDALAARAQAPGIDPQQAEQVLREALQIAETIEVRLAEARLAARQGRTAAAAQALRRAAALVPGDPRPAVELHALYQQARAALPRDLYGLLVATHRHLAQHAELSALAPEASQLLSMLDRPLLLTIMGEFNSGKSTFVNALLGEEVAPMGITPTTATINILKYGRERGGRVVYDDDQSRDVSWAEVPALLRALDEGEARRIRYVEVLCPLEALQRVNVVDTPGLNSIQPEHEATARAFIAEADAVVWLFSIDQAGKASERDALAEIARQGKQVLGVVNKIDRLTPSQQAQGPLDEVLAYLRDPDQGLGSLLTEVVPFSARDALYGQKEGDPSRVKRSNLPVLLQILQERFFARSQAIKQATVRARLVALLRRGRSLVEGLLDPARQQELRQAVRLAQADALLFVRDVIPTERRRLIADTDRIHRLAAREILDFVRPRRWPFGENRATPPDRDFLLGLLDEQLGDLLAASRARVVAALGERDPEMLHLLDEQVYGHYRAYARGYLRGGKVDDFFIRVLPRLELTEAAVARALERDGPTAIDILEEELLTPLRAFSELRFRTVVNRLQRQLDEEELRRIEREECLLHPLEALLQALEEAGP